MVEGVSRGDHICVERLFHHHDGLYLGDGVVIDFAESHGGGKRTAAIRRRTLTDFVGKGGVVRAVRYGKRFPPELAVARAESMLGRSGYDLFANNCEHFATWCVTGQHSSTQMENIWSGATFVSGATVVPRVGICVVAGMGATPARSAPNLMSGLKNIGGGSATTGVGAVATAGALAGAGSMWLAFRDKEHLPADERSAHSTARVGGARGGAIGVGALLCLIGTLGVPGYGAAGLSSGLSALGAPLGGGMLAGLSVASATPACLAALLALALYLLARWLRPNSDGSG